MIADRYPELWNLLAGYFHQDWDVEGSGWPDVVAAFRRDSTPAAAASAVGEIDRLLRKYPSDEELEEVLYDQSGCAYDPRPDLGGPSVQLWLQLWPNNRLQRTEGRPYFQHYFGS